MENCRIYLGGILAKPRNMHDKARSATEARQAIGALLREQKGLLIDEVWGLEREEQAQIVVESSPVITSLDGSIVEVQDGRRLYVAHTWDPPLVFRLIAGKPSSGAAKNKTTHLFRKPFTAMVAFDGELFMALIDHRQFTTVEEHMFCGPCVRDTIAELLTMSEEVEPEVVPPCIMPANISVRGIKDERARTGVPVFAQSIGDSSGRGCVLEYWLSSAENMSDVDAIGVLNDIHREVSRPLHSFYRLARAKMKAQNERERLFVLYDNTRASLRRYSNTPAWRIVTRYIHAGELGRDLSKLQVDLVDARISQARLLSRAAEIDSLEDARGVVGSLRDYLKKNITDEFDQSQIEYEGLTATLSYIDRLASQHTTILLGIVAVAAGLIGAVIGVVVS